MMKRVHAQSQPPPSLIYKYIYLLLLVLPLLTTPLKERDNNYSKRALSNYLEMSTYSLSLPPVNALWKFCDNRLTVFSFMSPSMRVCAVFLSLVSLNFTFPSCLFLLPARGKSQKKTRSVREREGTGTLVSRHNSTKRLKLVWNRLRFCLLPSSSEREFLGTFIVITHLSTTFLPLIIRSTRLGFLKI